MALVRGSRFLSTILLLASCSHPKAAPGTPAADAGTSTELESTYIPKDLQDAFRELDRILAADVREEMRAGSEDDMIGYHHGLGLWIRNEWGLWADSRLAKYFEGSGIRHPDDMSGIILVSYWRHVHGVDLRLDEQVAWYVAYWESAGKPENPLCPRDGLPLAMDIELSDVLPDGSWRFRHVGTCAKEHTLIWERGRDWREPTADEWPRIRGDEGGTVRTIGGWKD